MIGIKVSETVTVFDWWERLKRFIGWTGKSCLWSLDSTYLSFHVCKYRSESVWTYPCGKLPFKCKINLPKNFFFQKNKCPWQKKNYQKLTFFLTKKIQFLAIFLKCQRFWQFFDIQIFQRVWCGQCNWR